MLEDIKHLKRLFVHRLLNLTKRPRISYLQYYVKGFLPIFANKSKKAVKYRF